MGSERFNKQVLRCPQCGGTMEIRFVGRFRQDRRAVCLYCRSEMDLPETIQPQTQPQYRSPEQPVTIGNNTLAMLSFLCGIFGVVGILPVLGSIAAIIIGRKAIQVAHCEPELYGSEKLARSGVFLGWLGLGFTVLGCCFYVGAYGFYFLVEMINSF